MPTIEFQPTSVWRHDFRRLEMRFFDINEGDWETALNRSPEQLHGNYTANVHRLHVDWLNQGLPLADPLEAGDFDGETLLIALREDIVRIRIAQLTARRLRIEPPAGDSFSDLGLGHLA